MNDFLSNLIARGFTDAPVIQPRVPSFFETTGNEFVDEPRSSTPEVAATETITPTNEPTPMSNLSPLRETATTKSIANVSEATAEEHLLKPVSPEVQNAPVIAQASRLSVQTAEPRPIQSRRRRDFSPVERPSTSAPIIRVTIGRVEVRAVHSPAPTPKQAKPAPPRLSLEDYLHKRERGSR